MKILREWIKKLKTKFFGEAEQIRPIIPVKPVEPIDPYNPVPVPKPIKPPQVDK